MVNVTQLLEQIRKGDAESGDKLLPLIYNELHRLADIKMNGERKHHTLGPTALVHEAYLRLIDRPADAPWENQRHFYGAAAEAMRRILIEHARARQAAKRGGQVNREQFSHVFDSMVAEQSPLGDDLLELDEALKDLEATDAEAAELVKLRFFAGLSNDVAAKQLGISPRTASFRWSYARAWLRRRLSASVDESRA